MGEKKFTLRPLTTEDGQETAKLFYDTVHTVNLRDYTAAQADAWAPADRDVEQWSKSFAGRYAVAAVHGNGQIVGFGDLDGENSYFDRLYVHKDWQGRGVAALISDAIEGEARRLGIKRLEVHASITARGFFQKRGYRVLKENHVLRFGEDLTNYFMEKEI